mgnify:CR=1 FL=1
MTTVDFKAEVEKRRDEMMADLYSLLEINSERDDSKADAEHPFGPGPVKALEKFLEPPHPATFCLKLYVLYYTLL